MQPSPAIGPWRGGILAGPRRIPKGCDWIRSLDRRNLEILGVFSKLSLTSAFTKKVTPFFIPQGDRFWIAKISSPSPRGIQSCTPPGTYEQWRTSCILINPVRVLFTPKIDFEILRHGTGIREDTIPIDGTATKTKKSRRPVVEHEQTGHTPKLYNSSDPT